MVRQWVSMKRGVVRVLRYKVKSVAESVNPIQCRLVGSGVKFTSSGIDIKLKKAFIGGLRSYTEADDFKIWGAGWAVLS